MAKKTYEIIFDPKTTQLKILIQFYFEEIHSTKNY